MKKIGTMVCFAVVFFVVNLSVNLHAEEKTKDDPENTGELTLDGDALKKKSNAYDSVTEIGDIILFTKSYEEQLTKENKLNEEQQQEVLKVVFTKDETSKSDIDVFQSPLAFSKVDIKKQSTIPMDIVIGIGIVLLVLVSFLFTTLYIQHKKEKGKHNADSDFDQIKTEYDGYSSKQ